VTVPKSSALKRWLGSMFVLAMVAFNLWYIPSAVQQTGDTFGGLSLFLVCCWCSAVAVGNLFNNNSCSSGEKSESKWKKY
jgi:hypothetical protein